jgi:hypothetical protein
MSKGIELPGGMEVRMPSPELELLQAIAQNTASMVSQLDMLIRIACQQTDKKVVKARLDAFDAARKAAENPVEAAAQEMEEMRKADPLD